jgi:deferrochelatase/peroxidase EfeB
LSGPGEARLRSSRRGFLAGASGLVAAVGSSLAARAAADTAAATPADPRSVEPFWGQHQAGITTPQQQHTYFAAFDLITTKRGDVADLLRAWTEAAARMTGGGAAKPLGQNPSGAAGDSGEALDFTSARLTLTFGFGAGLFVKDGHDRYGLAARRPEALVDLPRFNGDQLVDSRTGGDLSVQACAEDPQIAFHAVRQLALLASDGYSGVAQLRWTQTGFCSRPAGAKTPRNLMGFKDGTQTPPDLEAAVWVGAEGPDWMAGGSYVVVRRIRMALEHWDRTELDFQEQVVGRHKYSGAPLGKQNEFDALALEAADKDGNPVIPDNAHVRLAAAATNDGAQILRRGYSYNDGTNVTAERWPPWRQGLEYDAGLLFIAYQRDPRTGFIKIFENMSKLDIMNQFVTHTGGALFACPGGVAEGQFIGQRLFET